MYDFLRDDRLNATNPLSARSCPCDQSQYGGSLGGPLVPNRTFYFTNVEQRRLDQIGPRHHLRAERGRDQCAAGGRRLPGPAVATGIYTESGRLDATSSPKIDHQVSGRDQLSVRYSLYDVSARELTRRRRADRAERVVGLWTTSIRPWRSATR